MFKKCFIDGCDANAHSSEKGARGWCRPHYTRWWNHGDPLGGGTSHGEPARHLREVVLAYEGDECLIWPYAKNNRGYAILGAGQRVTRLVCEAEHGPPPTPKHEAAHSCGHGHLACVTKRHLSWKTAKANSEDKLIHGTHPSQLWARRRAEAAEK